MRKPIGYMATVIALIVCLVGLGTLVPRPFLSAPLGAAAARPAGDAPRTILVLSSEIHTDIAFPVSPDVVERFSFMATDGLDPSLDGARYVIAGWGGRSFYIETPSWSDLKPGPLLKALTVDRSVMHMALAGPIDLAHPAVRSIQVGEAEFQHLLDAVLASFSRDSNLRPMVLSGAEYTPHDRFYEAEGAFNALVGCNVWTARMLRTAGLRSGWWTPLPGLLTWSLDLHNPAESFDQVPELR